MKRKINFQYVYQILIFLLIFSFPFSSKLSVFDLGLFQLYAFRLILIVCFFVLLFDKKIKIPFSGPNKFLVFFCFYIIGYALLSLLWVNDVSMALQQIFHLFWGVTIVIVVFSLLKAVHQSLNVFVIAWTAAFFTLSLFAFFEISAVIHFDGNFIKELEMFDSARAVFSAPMATFTNPNDYAVFLVLSVVVLTLFLNMRNSVVFLLVFIFSVYLLSFVNSNIADYSIYFFLVLFGLYVLFHVFLKRKISSVSDFDLTDTWVIRYHERFMIVLIVMFSIIYAVSSNSLVIYNRDNQTRDYFIPFPKNSTGLMMMYEELSITGDIHVENQAVAFRSKSYNERMNLIISGFCFARQSYFFGIGAGQFMHCIQSNQSCVKVEKSADPHCFTIELLSQYGVIPVISLFVFMLISMFRVVKMVFRKLSLLMMPEFFFILQIIPLYFLLSNAPSSFISLSLNWIVLALIAFMNEFIRIRKNENYYSQQK